MNEETTALAPVLSSGTDQLLAVAESAEKRLAAIQKILHVALKITNHQDWVDLGGKPYLQSTGAEKIARMFGICWRFDEPSVEFSDDGHFTYTYKGYFVMGSSEIEVIGTRSSKDVFFSRSGGEDIPPSEIDRADVKKSAYTNCINNGITRLLGIRNLTWDQVRGSGIAQEKSGSVTYGKDPNAAATLPNYGNHKGKLVDDPSVPVDALKYYLAGAEKSIADPAKAKFKAKEERLRDAIKAELAKREASKSEVLSGEDIKERLSLAESMTELTATMNSFLDNRFDYNLATQAEIETAFNTRKAELTKK